MEAQGPIPDLLRKVLTAYETVSSGTGMLQGVDGTSSTRSTSSSILPRPQLCAWGGPGMGSPQSHWIHRRAGGGPAGRCPEGPHRLWTPQTWDPTNLGPRRPHLARGASCGAAHGGRNPIKSRSPEPLPSFVLQGDLAARQALAAPHLAAPCQGDPQPTPSHPLFSPHLLRRQGVWGGMWGAGGVLSTSRCPSCPQMIQTSRTLIESADAVHSKLIQAQQAGGCWGGDPRAGTRPKGARNGGGGCHRAPWGWVSPQGSEQSSTRLRIRARGAPSTLLCVAGGKGCTWGCPGWVRAADGGQHPAAVGGDFHREGGSFVIFPCPGCAARREGREPSPGERCWGWGAAGAARAGRGGSERGAEEADEEAEKSH